jgi:uncharacterized protein (TIRG00374 family)
MDEIKKVKSWKIFLPVILGLGVVAYMFCREFKISSLKELEFTWLSVFWLFVSAICIFGRDFGYMVRIRILSEKQLSWRQSLRIIMLWEFTSAITPSSMGGTSVALMYIHKEGLSVGKSSAIVMVTSLLDELYFVLMLPIVILIIGGATLFNVENPSAWAVGILWLTVIAYLIKLVWVLLMIYGLFVNPRRFGKIIFSMFHLPFLKRWRRNMVKVVQDIETSSTELKSKNFAFWFKALLCTFLSWTSRYFVVNCLFLAFFAVHKHFLIFARQLVMWIALLITPTPGGSGIAEGMFDIYLSEFISAAGLSAVFALLWRLVTYYPYLVIGAFMMPKWINDNFMTRNK